MTNRGRKAPWKDNEMSTMIRFAVEQYINGNITNARQYLRGRKELAAAALIMLRESPDSLERFLELMSQ